MPGIYKGLTKNLLNGEFSFKNKKYFVTLLNNTYAMDSMHTRYEDIKNYTLDIQNSDIVTCKYAMNTETSEGFAKDDISYEVEVSLNDKGNLYNLEVVGSNKEPTWSIITENPTDIAYAVLYSVAPEGDTQLIACYDIGHQAISNANLKINWPGNICASIATV